MKIIAKTILLTLFAVTAAAEHSTDSTVDSQRKFGNYFNPGISFGYGEGHVKFPIPSIAFRMGRFHVKGMFPSSFNDAAIQVQLDAITIRTKHPKRSLYFTIGGGITQKWVYGIWSPWLSIRDVHSYGTGLNYYLNDKRSKFSGNISFTNMPLNGQRRYFLGTQRSLFGQASYTHYLFKSSPSPKKIPSITKQGNLDKGAILDVSKFFNPYFSLGLGLDRPYYVPVFGFKFGPVSAQFGANVALWEFPAAGSVNIDLKTLNDGLLYHRVLGVGYNYYHEGYQDIYSGYELSLYGPTINYNTYRKRGKHGFSIKLGIGQRKRESSYSDPDTWETSYSTTRSFIPNGGISFNLYLFRMDESKKNRLFDNL